MNGGADGSEGFEMGASGARSSMTQRIGSPRIVVLGALVAIVGLVIAAAALPALGWPVGLLLDATAWPIDGLPGAPSTATERLLAGITGGVMAGWGVSLALAARGLGLRRAARLGGATWFALDSLASIAAGMPLNIAVNVLFLALIAWATMGREEA